MIGETTLKTVIIGFAIIVIVAGIHGERTENAALCKSNDMSYVDGQCVDKEGNKYSIELKKVLVPKE